MKRFVSVILFCVLVFSAGCSQYNVSVDSINDGRVISAGMSCCVLSGMEGVADNDLRFKEFAACVSWSLESRGYVVSDDPGGADVVVLLSYGMEDHQEYVNGYSPPIYGDFGSSTTFGAVESHGKGGATYLETTVYSPDYYDFGRHGGVVDSYVEYTCFAHLVAYEGGKHAADRGEMLWETDIVSTGSSGDMRRVFPVMIGAATAYLGENTQERTEVVIGEEDEVVKMIRGG